MLVRKPLQESLFVLESMIADRSDFAKQLATNPLKLHSQGTVLCSWPECREDRASLGKYKGNGLQNSRAIAAIGMIHRAHRTNVAAPASKGLLQGDARKLTPSLQGVERSILVQTSDDNETFNLALFISLQKRIVVLEGHTSVRIAVRPKHVAVCEETSPPIKVASACWY